MGAQVSEQDLDDWPTRKRGISWPIEILFLRPCARENENEKEKPDQEEDFVFPFLFYFLFPAVNR